MLETEVFKKRSLNKDKLIPYGFIKDDSIYKYSKNIMDNIFKVDITIDSNDKFIGKVYDLDTNSEYTNFRLENVKGDFINKVKDEYLKIIKDIANNCYIEEHFIYKQSNRIANLIQEKYNVSPEFLWDKFPNYAVFRNKDTDKWFGIIMNIDKSKIIPNSSSKEIEILNIKVDDLVEVLLKGKGIYPSYHLSKKSWITIILDDILTDNEVIKFIDISYGLSNRKKEWIVPANPKYYDVVNAFNDKDTIIWKQSNNILVGDKVYLYVAVPYSCIMFKCTVLEVNLPYHHKNNHLSIKKVMKIKLLKRYKNNEFTFKKLNEYGVKAIRGPRSVPSKLSKDLNKY